MASRVIKGYAMRNDAPREVFDTAGKSETRSYAERMEADCQVTVNRLTPMEMEFDLVGVDVSIANALRRIMLAEVPTVAIEYVYIQDNSSIVHDEVLAHRLGLVPINVHPKHFVFKEPADAVANEHNTLVFKLRVDAPHISDGSGQGRPRAAAAASGGGGPRAPVTTMVYSSDLQWVCSGNQDLVFPNGVRPVHEDILLAKLRPGQSIQCEAHCNKGVGKDHAKYSPVATASYRLLPEVTIVGDVRGDDARELVAKCPMKVFDIEDTNSGQGAIVARPRDCTMCRECTREAPWNEQVRLGRAADQFIFSIESVGMLAPDEVLREAVGVLRQKCRAVLAEIAKLEGVPGGGSSGGGGGGGGGSSSGDAMNVDPA